MSPLWRAQARRLEECGLYSPHSPPFWHGGRLALIGAVVAEFVAGTGGTRSGLAFRILDAGCRLRIPRLFAALFLRFKACPRCATLHLRVLLQAF